MKSFTFRTCSLRQWYRLPPQWRRRRPRRSRASCCLDQRRQGLQRLAEDRRSVQQEERYRRYGRASGKGRRSGQVPAGGRPGKGPDIWCWPHDRMGEWAQSGLIVPINPSKKVHDAIEDTAWNAFKFQGKTWGYPISVEAIGLIYNKALVKTPSQEL